MDNTPLPPPIKRVRTSSVTPGEDMEVDIEGEDYMPGSPSYSSHRSEGSSEPLPSRPPKRNTRKPRRYEDDGEDDAWPSESKPKASTSTKRKKRPDAAAESLTSKKKRNVVVSDDEEDDYEERFKAKDEDDDINLGSPVRENTIKGARSSRAKDRPVQRKASVLKGRKKDDKLIVTAKDERLSLTIKREHSDVSDIRGPTGVKSTKVESRAPSPTISPVVQSSATAASVSAAQAALTPAETKPPKRKLPTIKKNKPPQTADAAGTPQPSSAGTNTPATNAAGPGRLDLARIVAGSSQSSLGTPPSARPGKPGDFDLNNPNVWNEIMNSVSSKTMIVGRVAAASC
jgi:hypothetical protein